MRSRSKELKERIRDKIKIELKPESEETKPLSVKKKQKIVIPGNHEEII